MKNKINIAELLKDCPKGMELDCTMFENVTLEEVNVVDTIYPIIIRVSEKDLYSFTAYGECFQGEPHAKCVLFPKGKTTWEGFIPSRKFRIGDIVQGITDDTDRRKIEKIDTLRDMYYTDSYSINFENEDDWELVSDKVEPIFKVGDTIAKKKGVCIPMLITGINDKIYWSKTKSSTWVFPISEQDKWELVSNKFDINTLEAFKSRVLVRDDKACKWTPAIWGYYDDDDDNFNYYVEGGNGFNMCIPFEGNEHLLGTTNDCNDYFKVWEN